MKISVIIPAYNQSNYLEGCIESVLKQDIDGLEIIIVNDGSTDKTDEICKHCEDKYNNVKYIWQKNKGLGEARNTGLNVATGEYILFLDSDDQFAPYSFGKLYSFAKQKNADIVYFDEFIADMDMNIQYINRTYPYMDVCIDKIEAIRQSLNPAHVWARMYKRTTIKDLRFKTIWYEDMDFFPQIITKASRLFYYKIPLYMYRQNTNGITSQEDDTRNLDVLEAWKTILSIMGLSKDEQNAFKNAVRDSINIFIFFKPLCAKRYLDFYNENFVVQETNVEFEYIMLEHIISYQQAEFYSCINFIEMIKKLVQLYNEGGEICFNWNSYCHIEVSQSKLLLREKNGVIECDKVQAVKGSDAIGQVIEFLKGTNVISLKGEVKKDIKIKEKIIEAFFNNNLPVEII